MKTEFFNISQDFNHCLDLRMPTRPLSAPPRTSRRHPSPEMRRQAAIAYAAALEVLG